MKHAHIHHKTFAWTAAITFIFLAAIIVALATYQLTLVSILVLAAACYFLVSNTAMPKPKLAVTDKAITVGRRQIPLIGLRWFRIFHGPAGHVVELQPLNPSRLPIGFHIETTDVEKIFKKLSKHLPLNLRVHETLPERLARWFKI